MGNPTKKANTEKRAPKGDITYKLNLTDEQKEVKRECYNYKINVITGDLRQNQLKNKSLSGFKELLDLKGQTNLIGFHELKENYRDPVVREVLELYNK